MSERWSSREEIREVLCDARKEKSAGGLILHHANGRNEVYVGDGHSLILGASGYGKTSCVTLGLVRNLADAGENMIIADPKGDLYQAHARYLEKKGYDVIVFDFHHLYQSARWNPLQLITELLMSEDPEKVADGMQKLEDLAHALFPSHDGDPFWVNNSRSLFIGMVQLLIKHAPDPEMVTVASVFKAVVAGEQRQGLRTYLKAFLEEVAEEESSAKDQIHSYVDTANETKKGIGSTFEYNLSPFVRSEALKTFMCGTDTVDIAGLRGDRKTAIFVILNDQSKAFDKIASALLGQLTQHYISLADAYPDKKLPIRMNVLLEELGNIGACLGDLDSMMSAARSRNVRLHLVLQAYSQLDDLYGKSAATTIRSNVKVLVAFSTNDLDTLKELSDMCGEKVSDVGGNIRVRPLITPARLRAMRVGEALIFIEGHVKYIHQLPFYQEAFDCSDWEAPSPRKTGHPADGKIFDLKACVDEAQRQKAEQLQKELEEERRKLEEEMERRRKELLRRSPRRPIEEVIGFVPEPIHIKEFPLDIEDDISIEVDKDFFDEWAEDLEQREETEQPVSPEIPFWVKLRIREGCRRDRVADILKKFGYDKEEAEAYAAADESEIPCSYLPYAVELSEALRQARAEAYIMDEKD